MARLGVVSLEAPAAVREQGRDPGGSPLQRLRERIREIEGGAPVHVERVRTGVEAIDGLVGGLPRPGIVELHGAPGSGRTRLALALAARLTAEGRLVAWVDADRTLYPPAVRDLDVVLQRLLVVRPPADRAVWAVEQVLRSGCFPVVGVSGLDRIGNAGPGWAHAAEAGGATLIVVSERPMREVPAVVRLAVGQGEAVVVRDRAGRTGKGAPLPPWPEEADPWS